MKSELEEKARLEAKEEVCLTQKDRKLPEEQLHVKIEDEDIVAVEVIQNQEESGGLRINRMPVLIMNQEKLIGENFIWNMI